MPDAEPSEVPSARRVAELSNNVPATSRSARARKFKRLTDDDDDAFDIQLGSLPSPSSNNEADKPENGRGNAPLDSEMLPSKLLHSAVRIVNLVDNPELNGQRGTVRFIDAAMHRLHVHLDDGSGTAALRLANLEPVASVRTSPPACCSGTRVALPALAVGMLTLSYYAGAASQPSFFSGEAPLPSTSVVSPALPSALSVSSPSPAK